MLVDVRVDQLGLLQPAVQGRQLLQRLLQLLLQAAGRCRQRRHLGPNASHSLSLDVSISLDLSLSTAGGVAGALSAGVRFAGALIGGVEAVCPDCRSYLVVPATAGILNDDRHWRNAVVTLRQLPAVRRTLLSLPSDGLLLY